MKNIKIITMILICMMILGYGLRMIWKLGSDDVSINDYDFINHYVTPENKSDVYEFDNGAAVVINDDKNIYELFIPELGDWSYECDSKQELFNHLDMYNSNVNDDKNYSNENLTMSMHKNDDKIKYSLSNGISVVKSDNSYQIYIPSMDNIPYGLSNKNDVENLVLTYQDYINK